MMTIIDMFKTIYTFAATVIQLLASLFGKEVDVPDLSDLGGDFDFSALLGGEDRARLLAAVRALPGPQRDVFLLRAAGVAFADIAARFGIPLNTALGRMHYAMKALRAALDPHGEPTP